MVAKLSEICSHVRNSSNSVHLKLQNNLGNFPITSRQLAYKDLLEVFNLGNLFDIPVEAGA